MPTLHRGLSTRSRRSTPPLSVGSWRCACFLGWGYVVQARQNGVVGVGAPTDTCLADEVRVGEGFADAEGCDEVLCPWRSAVVIDAELSCDVLFRGSHRAKSRCDLPSARLAGRALWAGTPHL